MSGGGMSVTPREKGFPPGGAGRESPRPADPATGAPRGDRGSASSRTPRRLRGRRVRARAAAVPDSREHGREMLPYR